MAPVLAALAALLSVAPGDRLFARSETLLLQASSERAQPVRALLPGDEIVWLEVPDDDLLGRKPPAGWILVQTVDVPSERSFKGWVPFRAMGDAPLGPER